ncbi:hypothetical protein [Nocardia sp. SSK8]|uniref:hypothetical protein n=1 Tax=Nocardia sp. SSK8 TaxID=3120154 RepID=UPI00300BFA0A
MPLTRTAAGSDRSAGFGVSRTAVAVGALGPVDAVAVVAAAGTSPAAGLPSVPFDSTAGPASAPLAPDAESADVG